MTADASKLTSSDVQRPSSNAAPAVANITTEYQPLPPGNNATFQTLDAMRDAVLVGIAPEYSGYQDEFNIRAARAICDCDHVHARNSRIAALFDYAQNHIKYIPHPFNQQTLQDAKRTMILGQGDCVSLSVLLATLLGAIAIHSRFVAQWVDGREASHVYVEAELDDGSYLALDAVARGLPMGWRQPLLDGGFEVSQEIFN